MGDLVAYQLPPVMVPARDRAAVTTDEPSRAGPFAPSWYVVPDDVAPHFTITGIHVGKQPQLPRVGTVPADLFSSSSIFAREHMRLLHDALLPSASNARYLQVEICNDTDTALEWRCSVVGRHFAPGQAVPSGTHVVCGLTSPSASDCEVRDAYAEPEVCFRPTHLYVPPRSLYQFDVVDACAMTLDGNWRRGVPKWMLAQGHLLGDRTVVLEDDPLLYRSQRFCVTVRRRTSGPANFRGAVVGELR